MTKYRPKRLILPGTTIALKAKNPAVKALGIGVDLLNFVIPGYSDVLTYQCGKPDCHKLFHVKRGEQPKLFCRSCGSEVDWSAPPPATRKAILCPKCGKEYHSEDRYCEYD